MKHTDFLGIIPEQYTGAEIDAEATIELYDESEAVRFFEEAKERLLNVNQWHKVATGLLNAHFKAFDKKGEPVNRKVQKGDFMRIDIPGPGSNEGEGYDWVSIEEVKEFKDDSIQSVGFRVRPTHKPNGDVTQLAHFYDDESTSTFTVTREAAVIKAYIIDRNTKPNDETQSVVDKIRNTPVAIGAIAKFSELQWQHLANGIVKQTTEE